MITHADFTTYPTEIIGINSDYDLELQAMELSAIEMLEYSGAVEDVAEVIRLVVFILFWNARRSEFVSTVGETRTIKEFTEASSVQKNTALFLAEKKLKAICFEKGQTADFEMFKLFYDHL